MPKNVQMPDGRVVEFPDSMNDDAIAGVLKAQQPPPSTNGATIGAAQSSENGLTQLLQQAGLDLSQGGGRTAIGRLLGQLQGRSAQQGYRGLNSGVSEGTANFMGSPELGAVNALQGVAMTPQHPIAGPVRAVSGALQAATIPGMMMGGPGGAAAIEAVPSKKFAGDMLNRIAATVGDAEVPINNSQAALQRLAELSARGGSGSVPPGVMQLLERSQGITPMVYPEARDFASNISALSAAEKLASKPQVLAEMGKLRTGLHQDIANALPAQVGEDYLNAIKEYAQASRNWEVAKKVGKVGGGIVLGAAGVKGISDTLQRFTR